MGIGRSNPRPNLWGLCFTAAKTQIPFGNENNYRGMFPCFFGGFFSRFVASMSSA
jgi:hypothetical protein